MNGIKFDLMSLHGLADYLRTHDYSKKGYICLPDFYAFYYIIKHKLPQRILNDSLLTLMDGKLIEVLLRIKGSKNINTISGYWLCRELLKTDLRHYFLGPDERTNSRMKENILKEFPDARICGFESLPFLDINHIAGNNSIRSIINKIIIAKPDIVWIGIGSPKQDILMNSFCNELNSGIMIGIGGVFDYMAGNVKISPEWIKKIGLRWLYRLVQNPRRFYKKSVSYFTGLVYLIKHQIPK